MPVATDTREGTHPWARLVRIDTVAGPELTRLDTPSPRAVVLLLHGGKERSDEPVDGRSASWRRMAALQRAVTPAAHAAGASTWLLRYRVRGWNGGAAGRRRPLGAGRGTARARPRPGRAARPLDGRPDRRPRRRRPVGLGVVALAPWFPGGETVAGLAGKPLRAAHGSRDRITSYRATAAYVERANARPARTRRFTDMGRVGPLHVPPGRRLERVRVPAVARRDRRHPAAVSHAWSQAPVQTGREKSFGPEWAAGRTLFGMKRNRFVSSR